jgi:hypothetical protein
MAGPKPAALPLGDTPTMKPNYSNSLVGKSVKVLAETSNSHKQNLAVDSGRDLFHPEPERSAEVALCDRQPFLVL